MRRSLFPAALAGPVLAACTGLAADSVTELPDGVLYAGAAQNGGQIEMNVGQTLRIELESIPTAGYIWEIENQPAFLETVGEGVRPTDPEFQNQPGVTGGNHYLSFDLQAVAPGSSTLHLVERRPWEENEPPSDTWSLDVTVNPAP
jgi:predicted secreted protein